jgi:hypothetical protein
MAPTEAQMRKICTVITTKGIPTGVFRQMLWDNFGYTSRKELNVDDAKEFIDLLERWQKPKRA